MPVAEDYFEQMLSAMENAIVAGLVVTRNPRILATFALKALLEAGFTPIKSIKELQELP